MVNCETCGKSFETYIVNPMICCSQKCRGLRLAGKNNPNWKGGLRFKDKRILVFTPNHPNCDGNGYVKNYRLVMERKIGRKLEKGEVIHHINGNSLDDREENLVLCSSQAEHRKWHCKSFIDKENPRVSIKVEVIE